MCEKLQNTEDISRGGFRDDKGGDIVRPAKERKIYLELIRGFSMLLVIFNHTGTRGFFLFSIANDSVLYPFYLFISVACKIAVPLYLMISGGFGMR